MDEKELEAKIILSRMERRRKLLKTAKGGWTYFQAQGIIFFFASIFFFVIVFFYKDLNREAIIGLITGIFALFTSISVTLGGQIKALIELIGEDELLKPKR